ncbi:MAG: alpha/beta fold hydrolase [Pseudomonadota bacterium]
MTWRVHDTANSHFVGSSNLPDLAIYVRSHADEPSRQPVLFVHGATYASRLYDIPHPGASWLKATADAGFAAYAMDVRGYGKSRLNSAVGKCVPFAPAKDAVCDIGDVWRWISNRHNGRKVALVGGSWGSMTTSVFSRQIGASLLSALILYAPIFGQRNVAWLDFLADPASPDRLNPDFGQTRLVSEADTRRRWDAEIPDGADWRDEAVFQALVQSSLSDDPGSLERDPPSFQAPNGTLVDLWEAFNGRPLYEPGDITCPVLLIRGGADSTSTRSDALALFDRLGSTRKHYVEIANGAHFVSAEKRAPEVFSTANAFLKRFAAED